MGTEKVVSPICMPSLDFLAESGDSKFTGKPGFVAGWGSTRFRGKTSPILMQATLSVQANEDCAKAFEEVSSANITPTKMCAIDEESIQDACQGDWWTFNAPFSNRGRWHYRIGLVSNWHCFVRIPLRRTGVSRSLHTSHRICGLD